MDTAQIKDAVARAVPSSLEDLKALVAIDSVSSLATHEERVRESAQEVVRLLRELGCPDVRIVEEGGKPAVIAHFPAPQGRPTVCLYAHHDVQPTGDPDLWTSKPFEATERDGRLYGRGTADDKGGIAAHLAALRAFDGKPPVGVTLFIEGEEEIGSPSLRTLIERHADALRSDVFVILDSGNWEVGTPAVTTSLRGLADCIVEVRTLDHALHSGLFGGVVPDALTTLCRLLATLHDEKGNVAVAGLRRGEAADLDYPEERLRAESGLLDGVQWIGDGRAVERLWVKPSVSVLAIDSTPVADASNTLAPSARAKVSLRVAPGDDADSALAALRTHLQTHASWGAQVTVTDGETGQPGIIPFEGPVCEKAAEALREAFGVEPVQMGMGGSIPMVADFQETFPGAVVLVTAVGDPDSRAHGIDESLDLGDFAKAATAEALLLAKLAE
ncbi:dipeptidase [Cumulibacter manganitolerans]|uniref:dipeptidase n=1 Tax=Cumulibacter manganitolerans TaxID=1884992 RepID=UPI00129691F2|nr:dipeptidase [Cumulibacter manganitolerans]